MYDKYEAFLYVAETGGLRRAAEALGYSQSALSRAIAALETEFGFDLFVRQTRGMTLTANGQRLLPQLRAVYNGEQQLRQTVGEINGLVSGVLRLGTFTSVSVRWLPGLLAGFGSRYPGIEVRLLDGDYEQMPADVASGALDCCFYSAPAPEDLAFLPLAADPMLAVLPPDHPLTAQAAVSGADLADQPFLYLDHNKNKDMLRVLERLGCRPKARYVLNDDVSVAGMVSGGAGVSILSRMVLDCTNANVAVRPLRPPCCRSLGLLTRPLRYVSPAVRRFREFVERALAQPAVSPLHDAAGNDMIL